MTTTSLTPAFALVIFLCQSCASSGTIDLADTSNPKYALILDHESRVAQLKMEVLKSMPPGNREILQANPKSDSTTRLAKDFKQIRLLNNSGFPVYADFISTLRIDSAHDCSVRRIALPRHGSIQLLLAMHDTYELHYSWESDGTELKTFRFKPEEWRIIKIHD